MKTKTKGATPENPTPTATVDPNEPGATPPIQRDTAAEIANLTSERDSANARIRELNSENKKYRLLNEAVTAIGATPETLKDQITKLEAFEALDLSADDLKTVVAEHGSMKAQGEKSSRIDGMKASATLAGVTNLDLLASLEGAMNVDYVVTGEGDAATATVKIKDASGVETVKPTADWVKETWPQLESVLFADAPVTQAKRIVPYGKSAAAGGGAKTQSVLSGIRERNAKTSDGEKPSFKDKARKAGMTR